MYQKMVAYDGGENIELVRGITGGDLWVNGKTYVKNDVVIDNNNLYALKVSSLTSTTRPSEDSTNWETTSIAELKNDLTTKTYNVTLNTGQAPAPLTSGTCVISVCGNVAVCNINIRFNSDIPTDMNFLTFGSFDASIAPASAKYGFGIIASNNQTYKSEARLLYATPNGELQIYPIKDVSAMYIDGQICWIIGA